jgi:hypothetical protein
LWAVAGLSLLWNGFGAYDYTMSHVQGESYFRQMGMTDAQIAYLNSMPSWMHGVWAIGVWGSLLGSVLLILRTRWALHAFALSFLGVLGNLIYTFGMSDGMKVNGTVGAAMTLLIAAICLFLVWYSWVMTKRGVLR